MRDQRYTRGVAACAVIYPCCCAFVALCGVYRGTLERWRSQSRKGRRYAEIMVPERQSRDAEAMLAASCRTGRPRPVTQAALGTASVHDTRLELAQEKTKVFVSLPIMPGMAESVLATPTVGAFLVVTEFGNKFRQSCDEVGLPNCSSQGLLKAAARRFAKAGCSNQEIKAWTGRTTDSEVGRYTAAADQRTVSDTAANVLMLTLRQG